MVVYEEVKKDVEVTLSKWINGNGYVGERMKAGVVDFLFCECVNLRIELNELRNELRSMKNGK